MSCEIDDPDAGSLSDQEYDHRFLNHDEDEALSVQEQIEGQVRTGEDQELVRNRLGENTETFCI